MDARATADAAIPAIIEFNPTLSKRPLTRLNSRGWLKCGCAALMLVDAASRPRQEHSPVDRRHLRPLRINQGKGQL